MARYKTILIAGPTASGKSSVALDLAARFNGVIVNTDSMQVYRDLRLITARPNLADEGRAPHRLYGDVDGQTPWSTGAWLRAVQTLLPHLRQTHETVIFVGGTGLYFNALTLGLSEIPETPIDMRENLRAELASLSAGELHRQLAKEDPISAVQIKPSDGQRIIRALEVLRHTGRSLPEWQTERSVPLIDLDDISTKAVIIDPEPRQLADAIGQRFQKMVEEGAADEVELLLQRKLNPQLPIMKAIGVKEIGSYLAGNIDLPEAVNLAAIASRQYAKRQRTWFRGQMDNRWQRCDCAAAALTAF